MDAGSLAARAGTGYVLELDGHWRLAGRRAESTLQQTKKNLVFPGRQAGTCQLRLAGSWASMHRDIHPNGCLAPGKAVNQQ